MWAVEEVLQFAPPKRLRAAYRIAGKIAAQCDIFLDIQRRGIAARALRGE
jgi:hypothetical protein